jgi:hypothetical protein
MMHNQLSWQHVVTYLGAASISAMLLIFGDAPEIAAVPTFLVWMMINRKSAD